MSRRLLRHKGAVVGLAVLAVLVFVAIMAPHIAPYDPLGTGADVLVAPNRHHLMGTDHLGRDIFTRVLYGTRISLQLGFVAVAVAAVCGTVIGLIAGVNGGWVATVLMRLIDALMAFPGILLALAVTAVLGPGLTNAMVAVGIAWIPSFARLVWSSVLQVNQSVYVEAARSMGCSNLRLVRKHILPNVLTPVIVLCSLGVASAILFGAALSFLGVGAQPPTPEWGAMLSQGRQFMRSAWWIMAFPGLAISLTVTAANLLGDGLRDALDPRLKL